jgi:hypothetical protein
MNLKSILRSRSDRSRAILLVLGLALGFGEFGSLILAATTTPRGLPPPRTAPVALDTLSDSEVDKALELIWTQGSRDAVRKPEAARRAALDSFLRGGVAGARLVMRETSVDSPSSSSVVQHSKFHSELLHGQVGYVRIGTFELDTEERLDRALMDLRQLDATRLILDLRASEGNTNLDQAGRLAARFVPKGTELFRVRGVDGGSEQRIVSGFEGVRAPLKVWVLTSSLTAGSAEVLAACLKVHAKAMLVGDTTKAEPAEYRSIEISEKVSLRLPVRDPVFAGMNPLFAGGLLPDVMVKVELHELLELLAKEAKEQCLADRLKEPAHSRMSEAALVSGDNPELEAQIRSSLGRPTQEVPIRDAVLQCALDAIAALEILRPDSVAGR